MFHLSLIALVLCHLSFADMNRGHYSSSDMCSYGRYYRCSDDRGCYAFMPYCSYAQRSYRSRSASPEVSGRLALPAPEHYSRTSPSSGDPSVMSCKQPVVISTTERRSKVYIAPRSSQYGQGGYLAENRHCCFMPTYEAYKVITESYG